MAGFWLMVLLLILIALGFLWLPILKSGSRGETQDRNRQLDVQAYRSRMAELKSEWASGRIEREEMNQLQADLDRNLLLDLDENPDQRVKSRVNSSNWPLALVLTLLVGGAAIGAYLNLGSSNVLALMAEQQALGNKLMSLSGNERINLLEREQQADPGNVDVLFLLAREYLASRNFKQAESAYKQLVVLTDEHPELLAEFAQASFFIQGNKITEQVRDLASRALAGQPGNSTALSLLGIDAFENQRYQEAIRYWERILEANPNLAEAESIRMGVARAKALAGKTAPLAKAAEGPELQVKVSLAEELRQLATADQSLFVFARAVQGPQMPLAVAKLTVGSLPADLVLNDSMAMSPAAKLSSAEQVKLVARISQSGDPISKPGDLEGVIGPINVNSTQSKIKIVIDKVVE